LADPVEKVGLPKLPDHWLVKTLFCTLLREIRVLKPLPEVKISISDAYFSDAQTMADFFNRIGRRQPVMKGCNRPNIAVIPQNQTCP
jgi:hypothetical protein